MTCSHRIKNYLLGLWGCSEWTLYQLHPLCYQQVCDVRPTPLMESGVCMVLSQTKSGTCSRDTMLSVPSNSGGISMRNFCASKLDNSLIICTGINTKFFLFMQELDYDIQISGVFWKVKYLCVWWKIFFTLIQSKNMNKIN